MCKTVPCAQITAIEETNKWNKNDDHDDNDDKGDDKGEDYDY